jgi:hypothetical protein
MEAPSYGMGSTCSDAILPSRRSFRWWIWRPWFRDTHRLRKIDRVLDLCFVREAVAACYSERGRPSVDPEFFLRMLLPGRLYDLSDRELCTEIGMCWFCGASLP